MNSFQSAIIKESARAALKVKSEALNGKREVSAMGKDIGNIAVKEKPDKISLGYRPDLQLTLSKDIDLSPDMNKITTVFEAILRKRQKNARIMADMQNIIRNKRTKRSSHESGLTTAFATTDSRRNVEGARVWRSNRRPRYSRRHRNDRQTFPRETATIYRDQVANHTAVPSTVFYKRIWEYLNGTRPHFDIANGYSPSEYNSDKGNSTCTDEDGIVGAQSQEGEPQTINRHVKPERELYKRIWDIINATQSMYDNARARAKRNAKTRGRRLSTAASRPSCKHERRGFREGSGKRGRHEEDERMQDKADDRVTYDEKYPQETSDPGPHISGFWTVANKTEWQPKTVIPVVNLVKLSNNPFSSAILKPTSALESIDLNEHPNKVPSNAEHSPANNSTGHEASLASREIDKPGPPYSSSEEEDESAASSLPANERRDAQREKNDGEKQHPTDSPVYDPLKIPYVEVPDYSDQREDSLERKNESSRIAATRYKEYDDNDYVDPAKSYDADDSTVRYPSSEDSWSKTNAPSTRCRETENEDAARQRNVEYDVDGTESHGDPPAIPKENLTANFTPVYFHINDYREPYVLDDFTTGNDSSRNTSSSEEGAERESEGEHTPDWDKDDFEEFQAYKYPRERPYDYFADKAEAESKAEPNEEETKDDETAKIGDDYYRYGDKEFLKDIFRENGQEADAADTEDEFLNRYFTEDVLRHLRDNSTDEEDRKREESRNREEVEKTLSRILDKKDRFSRLDEHLDRMIEEGKTIPIRYKNFWSLEYESPRRKGGRAKDRETEV